MGGKIYAILLTVVILGVALYVYNSGFIGKSAQGLGSLFPQRSTSTGPGGSFINPVTGPAAPQATGSIIYSPSSTGQSPYATPANIPDGFTASQLSPYFHEVRISGAYVGSGGGVGQISLYGSFINQNETIDITNWQIKSQRGGIYIPQAINIYDASGLTPASDIRMKANDAVYLYSSSAPFNLRINKCIGYVAHVANFNPPLPGNCPYIDRSQIQNFTGACQNYIYSIGSCQEPNLSDPRIPQNDYACRDYLANNFNYRSCVNAHQNDSDFLSNQVWVWTGSNNTIDQYHDKVQLLDRNGLLVDLYSY